MDTEKKLPSATALAESLLLAEPLVMWCLRHGVGHGQLSKALKILFYEQAVNAVSASGNKVNDSTLSLVSGLHRGDIQAFKLASQVSLGGVEKQADQSTRRSVLDNSQRISPVHQVLARWLSTGVSTTLPIKPVESGEGAQKSTSFTELVHSANRTTSQGFSTALVLHEMERLGLVEVEDEQVRLLLIDNQVKQLGDVERHFIGAGRDFLMAVLTNMAHPDAPPFLEQSVDADGLSAESVLHLQNEFRKWWTKAIQSLVPLAIERNEKDILSASPDRPAHRVRLGVYSYNETMPEQS